MTWESSKEEIGNSGSGKSSWAKTRRKLKMEKKSMGKDEDTSLFPPRPLKVYAICPVRKATDEQLKQMSEQVRVWRDEGHDIFYPNEVRMPEDETGNEIVALEVKKIAWSDMVAIFWTRKSTGSHFDLGVAYAFNKPIQLICMFEPDHDGRNYAKVIMDRQKRIKSPGKLSTEVMDSYDPAELVKGEG